MAVIRQGFGPHFGRFNELKKTFDAENFFQLNQNVPPA
jgi:hypothetical protein